MVRRWFSLLARRLVQIWTVTRTGLYNLSFWLQRITCIRLDRVLILPRTKHPRCATAVIRARRLLSSDALMHVSVDVRLQASVVFYNEIVHQKGCTPRTWRRIQIKVIHKKADVEDAGNCRPICALLALIKLLATVLYARLHPRLDRWQPPDQGGMLEQRCREWGCTTVHLDHGLHEGVRQNQTSSHVDIAGTLRNRTSVH